MAVDAVLSESVSLLIRERTGEIMHGTGKEFERSGKGGRRARTPATRRIFDRATDEVAALKSSKNTKPTFELSAANGRFELILLKNSSFLTLRYA